MYSKATHSYTHQKHHSLNLNVHFLGPFTNPVPLSPPEAPPISEPSTKRCKQTEGEGHGKAEDGEKEEEKEEMVVWQESPSRLVPPSRTAAVLPAEVKPLEGCDLLEPSLAPAADILQTLRSAFNIGQ